MHNKEIRYKKFFLYALTLQDIGSRGFEQAPFLSANYHSRAAPLLHEVQSEAGEQYILLFNPQLEGRRDGIMFFPRPLA